METTIKEKSMCAQKGYLMSFGNPEILTFGLILWQLRSTFSLLGRRLGSGKIGGWEQLLFGNNILLCTILFVIREKPCRRLWKLLLPL
jgi:hypothetical protein